MAQNVETADIFRSAYFLCNGGHLSEVQIKEHGRRIAIFVIRGEGLQQLDQMYRNGEALVNPVLFRESLTHLRDILFDKLRSNGGNMYDRQRENRSRKTRH